MGILKKRSFRIGGPAPRPLPLRPERKIMALWKKGPPVVSILCPTYNHANFIEDAIAGFLGQETTFPFEVIIRDDCSTDGTAEIVREYEAKYPQIIRGIYETENQFHRQRPLTRLTPLVQGQFIAICEGDDYWISPTKLERQLRTLRMRDDCVMSHHQALVVENNRVVSLRKLPRKMRRDFTADELQRGTWALTLSIFYRNVNIPRHPKEHKFINGDMYLFARLGSFGGAAYEEDFVGAVYRRQGSSIWSSLDEVDRRSAQATSYYYMASQYSSEGNSELASYWLAKAVSRMQLP